MKQQMSLGNLSCLLAVLCLLGMPLTAMGEYADVVLADNPVAYYQMNETSGTTILDSSGNGLDGTVSGSNVTLGVSSPIALGPDTAINLSGNTFIEVADDNLLDFGSSQDFSVEMWIKTTTAQRTDGLSVLINKGDTEGSFWIRVANGDLTGLLDYGSTADKALQNVSVEDDQWHQVVFVADRDTELRLYVDGTSVVANNSIVGGSIDSSLALEIGKLGSRYFKGDMDEVSIYASALTAEQVATHYEAASAVPEPSTIALLLCGLASLLYLRRK